MLVVVLIKGREMRSFFKLISMTFVLVFCTSVFSFSDYKKMEFPIGVQSDINLISDPLKFPEIYICSQIYRDYEYITYYATIEMENKTDYKFSLFGSYDEKENVLYLNGNSTLDLLFNRKLLDENGYSSYIRYNGGLYVENKNIDFVMPKNFKFTLKSKLYAMIGLKSELRVNSKNVDRFPPVEKLEGLYFSFNGKEGVRKWQQIFFTQNTKIMEKMKELFSKEKMDECPEAFKATSRIYGPNEYIYGCHVVCTNGETECCRAPDKFGN